MTYLYEYALVRYVPRPERGEWLNIGLVMMCKRQRWLRVQFLEDLTRTAVLGGEIHPEALTDQIKAFADVCNGLPAQSPIASLVPEERFRWLTAVRSAALQTTRPHPGLTEDLDATFSRLFAQLVE